VNAFGINNLAVGTTVASDSQTLLVSSYLRHPESVKLATRSKASMRGVGTVSGTVRWAALARYLGMIGSYMHLQYGAVQPGSGNSGRSFMS